MWSLNEDDIVNVKLSDYGISCFATPQGVLGEGGTPGFQAPEVKTGVPYDEKVTSFYLKPTHMWRLPIRIRRPINGLIFIKTEYLSLFFLNFKICTV